MQIGFKYYEIGLRFIKKIMQNQSKLSKKHLSSEITGLQAPQILPKSARIAHFGVGAFHRAHQALYTQLAMQKTKDDSWGILGVGIMPFDKKIYQLLKQQDCLYTLTQKSADSSTKSRIMGPIFDYIYAPENLELLFDKLSSQSIDIVTLTITEGGYFINKDTGQFDILHPKIVDQIQAWREKTPSTIYGYLTKILSLRKQTHGKGLTILSCDNIQHNGDLTAKGLLSFLIKACPEILTWVKENCTFPNSMVDRITPQPALKDIQFISKKFGINDEVPVVCQDFIQWVIQDKFAQGRPPWQHSGAHFVADVTPYEKMKLRILNGSHQTLCYSGSLHGYKFVHEAMQDQIIQAFVRKHVKQEVLETLDPVPGVDLNTYIQKTIQRFSNKQILDTLSRICEFTSDRIPLFNVPPMLQMRKLKKSIPLSAMIIASWIIYAQGTSEKNDPLPFLDNRKEEVLGAVQKIKETQDPTLFLALKGMFGNLKDDKQFCEDLSKSYKSIKEKKVLNAFKQMI